jgi:hypothetical protein
MAYESNLELAAHRHYADACKLLQDKRYDNAGYHFGLAAECAVKLKLEECGVLKSEDAFWKHWPTLRLLALAAISGRSAAATRTLLQRDGYMQYWDIVMRYSRNGEVDEAQAQRWKADANHALGLLV